jgi:RNA polymerase sigma-B factor
MRLGVEALQRAHLEYARTRDPALRERLVVGHLPLARQLAKRFGPRGTQTQDDVDQVASLALVKAIEGFDPTRGIRFSSYATTAILGELKRNLRDHTWSVRPSRSAHDLYLATEAAVEELTHELRRRPTLPELAVRLGVSVEDVLHAQEAAGGRSAASLDRPLPGGGMALAEAIGDDDGNLRRVEQRATVRSLLSVLSEDERTIVRLRFREGMSQAAIAKTMGSSQMHISRVLRRALERMRQASEAAA